MQLLLNIFQWVVESFSSGSGATFSISHRFGGAYVEV